MCDFSQAMLPGICFLGAFVGVILANVSIAFLVWVCGGMREPALSSRRWRDTMRR